MRPSPPSLRLRCVLPAFMLLAGHLLAAGPLGLFDSSRWSLNSQITSRLGYDSNLFARAQGEGDAFAELEPQLRLARLPSLTALSFTASGRFVGFWDSPGESSFDPALRMRYRYPEQDGALSAYEMDASVAQASVANSDLGRRVRETDWSFRWEGTVAATPKATLRAQLLGRRLSYREADLNRNESTGAGLMLAFVSNEKLELGVGYDLTLSRSTPGSIGGLRTNRVEHAVTFRGRGELTPTLTGRWYGGLARARYTGGQSRSDVDFIGGADLVWALGERLRLLVRADRRVYFSADGDAVRETGAGVDVHQEFARGFSATIGVHGLHRAYRRTMVFRRDHSFPLHAGVAYTIRPEFTAGLDLSWSEQNSDWAFWNYHRTTIATRVRYAF